MGHRASVHSDDQFELLSFSDRTSTIYLPLQSGNSLSRGLGSQLYSAPLHLLECTSPTTPPRLESPHSYAAIGLEQSGGCFFVEPSPPADEEGPASSAELRHSTRLTRTYHQEQPSILDIRMPASNEPTVTMAVLTEQKSQTTVYANTFTHEAAYGCLDSELDHFIRQ